MSTAIPTVEEIADRIASRVTYTVTAEPEDIPYEGNCSAHDPETDARAEQWIRDQLDAGNEWAWCCARVDASIQIGNDTITGTDYLGGCSYLSKEDFCQPGGYYDDMKDDARRDLAEKLRELLVTASILGTILSLD